MLRMWAVYAVIMAPAVYCGYRFVMMIWLNKGKKLYNIPFHKFLWFHGAFGGVYLVSDFVRPWYFNAMVCSFGASMLFMRKSSKLQDIEIGALQLRRDSLLEEEENLKRQLEELEEPE